MALVYVRLVFYRMILPELDGILLLLTLYVWTFHMDNGLSVTINPLGTGVDDQYSEFPWSAIWMAHWKQENLLFAIYTFCFLLGYTNSNACFICLQFVIIFYTIQISREWQQILILLIITFFTSPNALVIDNNVYLTWEARVEPLKYFARGRNK